jgi:hypothetical protein
MTNLDIAHQRLRNQQIDQTTFTQPGELVAWLGAVQSQDYAGAKWALGLRLRGASDDDIEQAFADGAILRTHVMRPTWHFVAPADIRWLLALTAPRVNALNAYYYRKLELDQALFTRSNAALINALQGGKQLMRDELRAVFQRAGIATDDLLRVGLLIMRAELDGIICSGARRGKQFTYALLDERAPHTRPLERDAALAELARRYFSSHGPATLKDFVWWSGLATADARSGLEAVKSQFVHAVIGGRTYWFSPPAPPAAAPAPTAYLLPNYDEYTVGYSDRSAVFDDSNAKQAALGYVIVLNGRIVGTWKRTLKQSVIVESQIFTPLTEAESRAIAVAAQQYGAFLDLPVVVI